MWLESLFRGRGSSTCSNSRLRYPTLLLVPWARSCRQCHGPCSPPPSRANGSSSRGSTAGLVVALAKWPEPPSDTPYKARVRMRVCICSPHDEPPAPCFVASSQEQCNIQTLRQGNVGFHVAALFTLRGKVTRHNRTHYESVIRRREGQERM